MSKVFTVENRKGGVGKTTTAATLAVGLANRLLAQAGGNVKAAGRVLLIDMDAQGDAARALGLDPNGRCISNILSGDGSIDVLKRNVMPADRSADGGPARPNLFVIPASDALSEAKEDILTEFALNAARSARRQRGSANIGNLVTLLDDKLHAAKQVFDYIIIDCPPTLDMLQQAVHQFADEAIVPVKVDYHGASATGRHTSNILEDQADGISIKIAAVVPTFVDGRSNLTKAMLQNIVQTYGRVVTRPIPNTVKVAEAPASGGLTVTEYLPDSPAAVAYDDLTDRIYAMR
jgi:chromosome partitioning protein